MLLARGLEDPYPSRSSFLSNLGSGSYKTGNGSPGISTVSSQAFLSTNSRLDTFRSAYKSGMAPVHYSVTFEMNLIFPQAATDIKLAQALENASAQQDQNKSLLRLTYVLQRRTYRRGLISEINLSLADLHSQSVIALLMAQPTLLENLRKAHQGNYGVILSLLGCLDHGLQAKRLVDRVIDACRCTVILHSSVLDLMLSINIVMYWELAANYVSIP